MYAISPAMNNFIARRVPRSNIFGLHANVESFIFRCPSVIARIEIGKYTVARNRSSHPLLYSRTRVSSRPYPVI